MIRSNSLMVGFDPSDLHSKTKQNKTKQGRIKCGRIGSKVQDKVLLSIER